MKILVTGGAGFIGSHIVDHFIRQDVVDCVAVLDKMTYAADFRNIIQHTSSGKLKLIVGDIINYDTCSSALLGMDTVIHAAAESHVDKSFHNSPIFSLTNAHGTHNMLEAFRRSTASRFLHVSTDEVYGQSNSRAYAECDALNPTNPYAASKAAAEMIVNSYIHSYGLPITVIRANNIYGVRQYPEKLIPKTIITYLTGKPAGIHGDGSSRRSFLSAADLCRAIELLLDNEASIHEIYNIASIDEYSVLEIVQLIADEMGIAESKRFQFEKDRPFNDKRYLINSEKIRSLGWAQKDRLLLDLKAIVEWYKTNYQRFKSAGDIGDEPVGTPPIFRGS